LRPALIACRVRSAIICIGDGRSDDIIFENIEQAPS
jgi:hypothetical protein